MSLVPVRRPQGQLGLGDGRDRLVPTQVTSLNLETGHGRMLAVSCGLRHAVALSLSGRVYTWGEASYGQVRKAPCTCRVPGYPGCYRRARLLLFHGYLSMHVSGNCETQCAFWVSDFRRSMLSFWLLSLYRPPPPPRYCFVVGCQLGHDDTLPRGVPTWVSCLQLRKVVQVCAGARATTVLTDLNEIVAWGMTTR